MNGRGVEAVLGQAFGHHIDIAFAIAEDDRVLEVLGAADQTTQRLALLDLVYSDPIELTLQAHIDVSLLKRHRNIILAKDGDHIAGFEQ